MATARRVRARAIRAAGRYRRGGVDGMRPAKVMMLLLATTALVLLAACGGGDKSAETVTVSESPAADRDYPENVRTNYKRECLKAGASDKVCSCTLDYIEERMTIEEFMDAEQAVVRGEPASPVFEDSIASCTPVDG
jgi:hypothetical protein